MINESFKMTELDWVLKKFNYCIVLTQFLKLLFFKMPLFGRCKSSITRKLKPRESDRILMRSSVSELDELDVDEIKLQLGDFKTEFVEGEWIHELEGDGKLSDLLKVKKITEKLQIRERENNMIRIKNEILLDKVAAKEIEIQTITKELIQLKRFFHKSTTSPQPQKKV